MARVSGGMGARHTGLPIRTDSGRRVVKGDAIFRVRKILCREPPRHGVVLHLFENEARA